MVHQISIKSWQLFSSLSPPHPNVQPQRLPQETFLGLKVILIQLKFIPSENSANEECKLHLGNVASHASTRAIGEWNESTFLPVKLSA